jgi:hypothetical protein
MTARSTAARRLPAALLLACAAAARGESAESLYVIEQLVVNVNSAPDASGERIATAKSGERMEVLERSGDQVHVRLPSGKDGWVRAGYLSADEPLRVRLAQRTAEVAQLKEDLTRLQSQLAAAHSVASAAPSGAGSSGTVPARAAQAPSRTGGALSSTAAPASARPEELAGPPRGALFNMDADGPPPRAWPWALGAVLLAFAVGFALGVLVLDRHIRRKYGGLRIY